MLSSIRQNCPIIDTHAHLDELDDPTTSIKKALDSGVKAIIGVGSNMNSNEKIKAISSQYPGSVYPAFGLHPWGLGSLSPSQITDTINMIEKNISGIVAIGEIGLDYDKRALKITPKEIQKGTFSSLVNIAAANDKPVSIHSRYSWRDCFEIVKDAGVKRAIFHWFTGPDDILRDILESGYYISCTPAAEYNEDHIRVIKKTPLSQLLLETDCPVTYGRENRYRSEPSDVFRSLSAAAMLTNTDQSTVGKQTAANSKTIFNLI